MTYSVLSAIRSVTASAVALRERWQSGVAYNPLSARTAQDPYPVYAALRARAGAILAASARAGTTSS